MSEFEESDKGPISIEKYLGLGTISIVANTSKENIEFLVRINGETDSISDKIIEFPIESEMATELTIIFKNYHLKNSGKVDL